MGSALPRGSLILYPDGNSPTALLDSLPTERFGPRNPLYPPIMRIRRLGLVALGLVVGALLSGCVVVAGFTGATVRDGHVIALVRMCQGVTADKLASGSWGPVDYSTQWEPGPGQSSDVDLGAVEEFIHGLDEDRFWIQTSASSGDGGFVAFSAQDLRELQDGDVMIDGNKHFAPTRVSAATFDATVQQRCN